MELGLGTRAGLGCPRTVRGTVGPLTPKRITGTVRPRGEHMFDSHYLRPVALITANIQINLGAVLDTSRISSSRETNHVELYKPCPTHPASRRASRQVNGYCSTYQRSLPHNPYCNPAELCGSICPPQKAEEELQRTHGATSNTESDNLAELKAAEARRRLGLEDIAPASRRVF